MADPAFNPNDWEDVTPEGGLPPAPEAPRAAESAAVQSIDGEEYEEVPSWGGYLSTAGRGLAQGAVTSTGETIKGAAELAPQIGAEAFNRRQLDVLDRIDRGETVTPAEDPIGYQDMDEATRKATRADMERAVAAQKAAPYRPQESPVFKAGEAVTKFGERQFPLTPEEKESITGRVATGAGAMAPALVAGALLGPEAGMAAGAAQFGLAGASGQAEAARAHGATPEEAHEAAEAGFLLNAAGATIPFHSVLRPIERLAPGIADWAATRLKLAAQSGVIFATVGEAQEWLGQEIAKHFYDPEAGYSFDIRRVIGSLLAGGMLAQARRTPFTGPSQEAAGRPAVAPGEPAEPSAATTPAGTQTPPEEGARALEGLLGGEGHELPEEENESILPGVPTQGQAAARDELSEMLRDNAPLSEIIDHPEVKRAAEVNRQGIPTGTEEDFANPEWRANRVYNVNGDEVQGWDNAVGALTKVAEGYSQFGPVEDGRHAIFVLGPPASGKSSISEPLARNYRAAIVDADDAKKIIPEYRGGLGTMAAHEESSKLSKDVLANLAERGTNLVIPKVGDSAEGIRKQIAVLRKLGYTVDIAHVAATPEIAGRRNIQRFLRTGRLVDPNYIKEVGDKPRENAYKLRAEADDFADADTSKTGRFEVIEGSGPLADTLRGGRYGGSRPTGGPGGGAAAETRQEPLIGERFQGIPPHRVTAADGTAIETAPVVVEASSLKTSQDRGYDASLQPRQRERAASQAQVRDIATNLDPERLGYSAEADRGAPIVGPDGMVESGNGRVLALRQVYNQGGKAAEAYRNWLSGQGIDVSQYRNPVLVRQRTTPFTPDQRRAFTVAANQAATLAMSAPERALSDADRIGSDALGLIHNAEDLGAAVNRPFFRRFVASLPQSEQGTMADAKGALSAEGLARVRNAILAKAYGDASLLSRIAESTNDEIKSISNALTAAAPQWARLRAAVADGRVRQDVDLTPQLLEAVKRTADIRSKGIKLDDYLAQMDAFDRPNRNVENFMQAFYHPETRRAAAADRIADALRFYAQEGGKVAKDEGLNLGMTPVDPTQITRLMVKKGEEDAARRRELSDRRKSGAGPHDEASRGQVRGPGLGPEGEGAGERGAGLFGEGREFAQRPDERIERVPLAGGKIGEQYVIPGAQKVSYAELARRRAAAPMQARVPQEIPGGLFGDLLGQEEMFPNGKQPRQQSLRTEAPELAQPSARGEAAPAERGEPQGLANVAPEEAGAARDRTAEFRAFIERQERERAAFKDEIEKALAKDGHFEIEPSWGGKWILTRGTSRDATPYRITFFDKNEEATGHIEVRDLDEAVREMINRRKESPSLTPPETVPNSAKSAARDLFGETQNEPARPARRPVRQGAPGVPGTAQPGRPTPAKRPDQLSLFSGEPSGAEVRGPDVSAPPQPGGGETSAPPEGAGVTKPPPRGGGDSQARPRTPTTAGIREAEQKIAERSRSNYRITDEDAIGEGGPKEKVRQNIDAIRTLLKIEEEDREATPAEKAILVKYVGWGAFAQDLFERDYRKAWEAERGELRALLNDAEYEAARASTLNAHYTSPSVIRGMWDALGHLGYDGGEALEPSAGIGHFIGLTPDAVAPRTAWTAVELDPISARLTRALYGGAEVNAHGFEELKRPSNYYDLAVSNVPFGQYNVSEKPYGSHPIHNFFFVKALDKVRPGGIVAFITSRYTMDGARHEPTRRLLAKTSDLVGAIRLPGGKEGAFAGNAGTEVTSDILFLRKKIPGEKPFPGASWEALKEIQTPEGPARINEYFADRPHMMLGEMRLLGTQYRDAEPVLIGDPADLQAKIAAAAKTMIAGSWTPRSGTKPEAITSADIQPGVKDGAFFLKGGKLFQRVLGQGVPHELSAADHDRVSRLIGLRDLYNDLLGVQLGGAGDKEALRTKMRDAYDEFVKTHGPINKEIRTVTSRLNKEGEPVVIIRRPNMRPFLDDPDAWKVASLENYDPETEKAKRADIQTKDVIAAPQRREINGPTDALAASLNDTGRVDLDHVAQSLGLDTIDEAAGALGDLIYHDPNGREWRTADDYLSGNVIDKLEEARALAQTDSRYLRNVAALEKVQPTPVPAQEITAQFGAPWVPTDVYDDFLREELGARDVTVKQIPVTGEWKVDGDNFSGDARNKYAPRDEHDNVRAKLADVVAAALNGRRMVIKDRFREPDGSTTEIVNAKATEDAANKIEALKEAFTGDPEHGIDGWIWRDPDRQERVGAIFNRTMNNLVNRQFDGSHLTVPGLNPDFATRKHRLDAVWRIIQRGNTLLSHAVGSGKTVTMIAAGMEQKRLGLIQKPAYVVPNHMLEQFSREFIQAYPNAKILVADKEGMAAANRKSFLAKVASNDWDGVVITHDAFGRVNMGKEFRRKFIQDQIDELTRAIQAEAAEGGKKSPTVKRLEAAKNKLRERLQKLMNEERKDEGTSFEESGVDFLFVDEAHLFKNLSFISRLGNIKGLGQGDAQRAEDLFLKIRYLEQNKPGRSAVFATGTPVSNTLAEIWTMMRYLELDKLRERELDLFDNWAKTYGKVIKNAELSKDGRTYKDVSSFSKLVNVPELSALWTEVSDTKTADMLNLPRPEVRTRSGTPGIEIVEAELSSAEEKFIQGLVDLAEEIKGQRPEPGKPNAASISTAGRKLATDGRLVGNTATDKAIGIPEGGFDFNPRGKIAKATDNIYRIWKEGNETAATAAAHRTPLHEGMEGEPEEFEQGAIPVNPHGRVQMVFLDLGAPQARGKAKGEAPKREVPLSDEDRGEQSDEFMLDPAQEEQARLDLYADLKQRLVDKGIPANEIAAIHDAKNDDQKARLFAKVRSGAIRVLIGSTGKMGVGTNVQDYLVAMHHLDAPWKPAEVEQRDGRIVRQGNKNSKVQIYRYVTKRSFDAFMWQTLERKAKFLNQFLSGAKGSRTIDDIDNALPEAAEMKAAASGDPRVLEHAELDRQVRALTSQRKTFEATRQRADYERRSAQTRVKQLEGALPGAKADSGKVEDLAGDKFSVDLGERGEFKDRKAAGEAIRDAMMGLDARSYMSAKTINIGKMSGFDMMIEAQGQYASDGWILRATPALRTESRGYASANDVVINEHTDAAGLMRRFENILGAIKREPERLADQLKGERENLARLDKTLTSEWPREQEYRDAIAKLDKLTGELKAPQHPDVDSAKAIFNDEGRAEKPQKTFGYSELKGAFADQARSVWAKYDPNNLASEDIRARKGWDVAEGRDLGPKPGEKVVRLGPTTVAHLSPEYSAAEKKIAAAVQAIGQRMAPQARVQGARALRMQGASIWGYFTNSEQFPHFIAWSLEKAGPMSERVAREGDLALVASTVRHEIIHHLREAELIRPHEWDALAKAAKENDWLDKFNIKDRYPGLSEDRQIEEAVAEQFSVWRGDRQVIKGLKDPIQRLVRDAFNRLDLMFRRVAAAARQFLGKGATANDIFTRIETGEVGRRKSEQIEAQKQYFAEREAASRAPGFYFDAKQSQFYKKRTDKDVGLRPMDEIRKALETDATARRIMAKGIKINDGEMVGARLNLNVMKKTGVPVQAIHKGNKGEGYKNNKGFWNGEVLGYEPVVTLKDAYLNVHQPAREAIARGEAKAPMASVDGKYSPGAHSFDGVEFRFNPKREHLFVDPLGRVLRHADEVTIHGNSVFARGHIEYYGPEDVPARAGETPTRGRLIEPGREAAQKPLQTETPEFKRWFGKSKVVDAKGEPLKVYHHTYSDFHAFEPGGEDPELSGHATWFTLEPNIQKANMAHQSYMAVRRGLGVDARGNKISADAVSRMENGKLNDQQVNHIRERLDEALGAKGKGGIEGGRTIPAYLKIENPAVFGKRGGQGKSADITLMPREVVDRLKAQGHDGAISYRNGKPDEFIVFDPEQIKSATGNSGEFSLFNSDIRAQKPLFSEEEHARQPAAQRIAQSKRLQAFKRAWTKTFQPELVSDRAFEADPLFAAYRSGRANGRDLIFKFMDHDWQYWNKRNQTDQLRFIDDMEHGRAPADPEQARMAQTYKRLIDANYRAEKNWGSLAGFVQDYFPHIWKKPEDWNDLVKTQTAQLGPTWFQKERTIDYIKDGLNHGLELRYSNPVDMLSHRFLSGVDMRLRMELLHNLKKLGLAWEGKQGGDQLVKRGWRAINAPDRKQWVIAPDIQQLWNNAVEAKSLWQDAGMGGRVFRGWMAIKNVWVPIKLAISAFHPLHVMHIDQAQSLALAYDKVRKGGDFTGAMRSVGEGLATIPTAGMIHYKRGAEARQAWLTPEGQRTPEQKAMVRTMIEGGFKPQLSEEMKIGAKRGMQEAFAKIQRGEAGAPDWLKWSTSSLRHGIEMLQGVIFEKWIPALKASAYMDQAHALLQRRPELLTDEKARRIALRTIAKSIDNRYGEMNYDTLFWDRHVKDAGIASFLSLGWNLGFVREFGGAAGETAWRGMEKLTGVKPTNNRKGAREASNKLAFAVSYVGTAMLLAGAMTYLFTGKRPDGLDWIFPRIGGENPDGSPRRVTTMFYTREVPMLLKHVQERDGNWLTGSGEMLWNKLMFEPFHELLNNRDYYGYDIWDTQAPLYKQMWQGFSHFFASQLSPMAISGATRAAQLSGKEFPSFTEAIKHPSKLGEALAAKGVGLSMLGFGPAPAYVEKSALQNRIGFLYQLYVAPTSRPEEQGEHTAEKMAVRQAIMNAKRTHDSAALAEAEKRGRELGMSSKSMQNIGKVPPDVYMFSRLPDELQKDILKHASPEDKARYLKHAHKKVKAGLKPEERAIGGAVDPDDMGANALSPNERVGGAFDALKETPEPAPDIRGRVMRPGERVWPSGNRRVERDDGGAVDIEGGGEPVPKPGQKNLPPVNVRGDQDRLGQEVLHGMGDVLGINDSIRALRGEMNEDEARDFTLAAAAKLAPIPGAALRYARPVVRALADVIPKPVGVIASGARRINERASGGRVDHHNINHTPTEAQKSAGNYAKDHLSFQGLPLTIENARGSFRCGIGPDGEPWQVLMPCHYGYIKRTEGADGDHVDIYLGPHRKAPTVFIIDQVNAGTGKFDEHKAFLGFASKAHVLRTYKAAFSDGRAGERLGKITTMPIGAFKDWLRDHDTTKAFGEKKAHSAVAYVEKSEKSNQRCALCSMFVTPAYGGPACTDVKSPIKPTGWCKKFYRGKIDG